MKAAQGRKRIDLCGVQSSAPRMLLISGHMVSGLYNPKILWGIIIMSMIIITDDYVLSVILIKSII